MSTLKKEHAKKAKRAKRFITAVSAQREINPWRRLDEKREYLTLGRKHYKGIAVFCSHIDA
jgi:hypothetical protein